MHKCTDCGKEFRTNNNLKRHRQSHDASRSQFECTVCGKVFTRNDALKRHRQSHDTSRSQFECTDCRKVFIRHDALKRHRLSHDTSCSHFMCFHCSKIFQSKTGLLGHISLVHRENEDFFECHHCGKKIKSKNTLQRHIEAQHYAQSEFECYYCGVKLTRKYNLQKHIEKKHLRNSNCCKRMKTQLYQLKCLKCANIFVSTKVLNDHYTQAHGVSLEYENLEFDCVQKFEEWRENMQHRTISQFIKSTTTKRSKHRSYSTIRYICHRSKTYCSSVEEDDRKRCLKLSGYKGLGGRCPAEILLTIQNDDTCCAKFQKTHVGHNIKDISELRHIYMSKAEKQTIASKIANGIPFKEIVNQERSSRTTKGNVGRLSLLNCKDVRNIAVSNRLRIENQEYVAPGCDGISTEAIIIEHESDIVFYKRQGEEDLPSGKFQKDDFVLIIMTESQKEFLRLYGNKVVAMDGNHYTDPYGFTLHTLLVLDADNEGRPAAFLVSNKSDQDVIDVFLTCIRDEVGTVTTQTLITDMQMTYYNSWVKIMSVPDYFLFCTWHVHEAWQKNLKKITIQEKRNLVKDELIELLQELDPVKFEDEINLFLSNEDEDLQNFLIYFQQNYCKNTNLWAYCYRNESVINSDMHVEVFYRQYKRDLAGKQTLKSICQCVLFVFEYLTLLQTRILEKELRGKITAKLTKLRNRHRTACDQYKKNALSVLSIGKDIFLVQSFQQNVLDVYTISKNESKECLLNATCNLFCNSCRLCLHDFKCSCIDSSIGNNMCKHIHLVGLNLKNGKLPTDFYTNNFVESIDAVESVGIIEPVVAVEPIIVKELDVYAEVESVDKNNIETIEDQFCEFIKTVADGPNGTQYLEYFLKKNMDEYQAQIQIGSTNFDLKKKTQLCTFSVENLKKCTTE